MVLLMLLAAGANPDVARNDGATPLWIASQMGHDHIVKVLLQNGAYVDSVRCVSSKSYFPGKFSKLSLFQDGATPLFKASHKGHSQVVQELLKYRPNLGLLPVQNAQMKICSNLLTNILFVCRTVKQHCMPHLCLATCQL